MEDFEDLHYRKYTSKTEANKAFNILCGIVEGISMDNIINEQEIKELEIWCENHNHLMHLNPFRDVVTNIQSIITNIDDYSIEVIKDLKWLCENYKIFFTKYDVISSELQNLNGILHGIMADGDLLDSEIYSLANWLEANQHLSTFFPYDKILNVVGEILEDSKIDETERLFLKNYFKEFIIFNDSDIQLHIDLETKDVINKHTYYHKVAKVDIIENQFCFTGTSSKNLSQHEIKEIILERGGKYVNSVSSKTKYLVVGDMGNPSWAFATFGRKIQEANNLNSNKGLNILIIHEDDFWKEIE
jgi:hypothetical protein